jgi:NADH:ubiquinone oxidoreductase subunit
MTVSEVFSIISAHQVEGMMLHNDMADYYDFLGLMGFKRMHEYHFLEETASLRGTHRYYINHYNMLVEEKQVKSTSHIPDAWVGYTRQSVDQAAKKNAVQSCMEKWVEWERSTKKLYEEMYCALCDAGEIASAMKVKELICDVDCELKCADRLHIELKSVGYDLSYIFFMQDTMHEEYREKSKKIGVDIC